jgi:hypothetical protein
MKKKRISIAQERHWIFSKVPPRLYNIEYEASVTGIGSPEHLAECFYAAINNNAILKYVFTQEDGAIFATPYSGDMPSVRLRDLRGQAPDVQQTVLSERRRLVFSTDFDLWSTPAYRAEYISMQDDRGVLLVCASHILMEGGSMEIFIREVFDRVANLPVRTKYVDFYDVAEWEREHHHTIPRIALEQYWRNKLAPYQGPLHFSGAPRPAGFIGKAGTVHRVLKDRKLVDALRQSDGCNLTIFTRVLAAVACSIYSHYGESPLAIPYPVSTRDHPQSVDVVGYFLSHNIFLAELTGETTFSELLKSFQQQFLDDIKYRALDIREKLACLPASLKNYYSKCQIRFHFDDQPEGPARPGITISRAAASSFTLALSDLHYFISVRADNIHITLLYLDGLFNATETIALIDSLEWFMRLGFSHHKMPLSDILAQHSIASLPASTLGSTPSTRTVDEGADDLTTHSVLNLVSN